MPAVTPETLTDEMIRDEQRRAADRGDYALQRICDAINARAGKESK